MFPSLRKFIKQQARLVTAAEYHQMAGRAGRPQFDDRGLAITLAPEEVVSELSKELKDAAKRPAYDDDKVKKSVYDRARSDAQRKGDVIVDARGPRRARRAASPPSCAARRRSPPSRCSRSGCPI